MTAEHTGNTGVEPVFPGDPGDRFSSMGLSARDLRSISMQRLSLVGLWCLTTAVSILAAEPSGPATPATVPVVGVLAGPWMLLGDDGLVRCGLEIADTLDPGTVTLHHGGKPIPAAVGVRPFRVASRPAAAVVEVVLPRDAVGEWTIVLPGRTLTIHPTLPPTAEEPSRVVFASADNWPRPADLTQLAERMGGPAQVIVAYGTESSLALGSGGWEARLPVVLLPQPLAAGMRDAEQLEIIAAARLGILAGHWSAGTRWGNLGLPWASDRTLAAGVIARDLSPWEVCLVPTTWWELGLLAPRINRTAAGTAPLLSLCQHLHVPFILTLGSRAGWISEPLVADGEVVRSVAGGTRVIAATPAGDGLGLLPASISAAIDEPGLIALVAEPQRLRVVGVGLTGATLVDLEVRRDADGFTGDGVGRGAASDQDLVSIRAQWLLDDATGVAARRHTQWQTLKELATYHTEGPDVFALATASATLPAVVPILRRLAGIESVSATAMMEHRDLLPPLVVRDLLLRHLATPASFDAATWTRPFATTSDHLLLSAVLRAHQDGIQAGMLDLLLARVRAQAEGTTAIDGDALRQHRLMTAVFDSTTLSPTVLRPLAVALRPMLSPFTAGPVERFIARHGEVRR